MIQPYTMEDLKQYCKENRLPSGKKTGFFIGKNDKKPNSFGIYKVAGEYIVYRNLIDGKRVFHYRGTDEAAAVQEIYDRLNQKFGLTSPELIEKHKLEAARSQRRTYFKFFLLLLAAAAIFAVIFVPHYLGGLQAMQNGNYNKAAAEFAGISWFPGMSQKQTECIYRYAEFLHQQGSYEEAAEQYGKAGDYLDAAEKIRQCYYQHAESLYQQGSNEKAAEQYGKAGDYLDAAEKVNECTYQYAESLYQQGFYEAAAEQYDKVGDYREAKSKSKASWHKVGEQAQANGAITSARKAFGNAGDYQKVKECWYLGAEEDLSKGNISQACEEYKKAVDYQDASEKRAACSQFLQTAACLLIGDTIYLVFNQQVCYRYQPYDGPTCDVLGNPYAQEDMQGGYILMTKGESNALYSTLPDTILSVQVVPKPLEISLPAPVTDSTTVLRKGESRPTPSPTPYGYGDD